VGYAIATLWMSPASANAHDGSIVQVPDVVGEPEAKARSMIEAMGLEYTVRRGLAHREAPEGTVLAQSPLAGQFARPGAPVDVTLSRGPEVHTLPDVAGLSERQANIVLERLGYDVEIERREDPMAAGRAVETRPGAGTDLEVPSPLVLVVSEGAPIVVIPDMVGMHIDDALQILTDARLELGSISFDSEAPEAPGRIVGQYPPVGYSLRAGDTVELRVAGDANRVNDGLDFRERRAENGEPELL
jgi:serine/threonine-protein kinase